ncbi:MAG: outer membrane protein transport protein, partial [Nitrospirota bacterium]|nr:outer membrane protein transport protein [Nitrospirota bacterium]
MNCTRSSLFRAALILFLFVTVTRFYASDVFAAGYKIPEQSLKSVGLGAAYVANASGPDSAYFNPANMVWSDEGAQIETSLIYIYLPSAKFEGSVFGNSVSADSKSESFVLPNIHYISPKLGKARVGFSVVYPFGLSKRWNDPLQQLFAEEFTLEIIELDLSVAFEVSEQFAVGWGIRGIFSEGKVVRRGALPVQGVGPVPVSGDMEGDDFSTGYFLALSARPIQNLSVAVTYRSEVTPTLEGDARISSAGSPDYNGLVELGIVLPAALQVATAYTHNRAVFEFVYEKTYWGGYSELDFQFQPGLAPGVQTVFFDDVIEKNYSDSDTYRFGLTYHYRP